MEMNKKKHKLGIFSKLVISYLIFAVLIVITFTIMLLVTSSAIVGNSDMEGPFDITNQQGELCNLDTVKNLYGWVEVLDENYEVQQVYGEKQTTQNKYSQEEIYKLLSANKRSEGKYVGGMALGEQEGKSVYYLVLYKRNVVSLGATILLSADNALSGWTKVVIAVFFVAFLLECLGFGYYLSRKVRRPLKQMVDGMQQIQEGNRHVRMEFKTEAEFEEIRDTFNTMMETIEVQEKEKSDMEAKKSKMLLELSHDIKTPIATIKSYAAALEADVAGEDKKKEYYRRIDQKADRVCQLADDMFMMLKMDNPEYKLNKTNVNICEILRHICVEYYDEVERAGLQFETIIPEKEQKIDLDVHLFSRAVGELLINAIKYNHSGTKIRVVVILLQAVQEKKVILRIEDDGAEVKDELTQIMFDAFSRGDKARKTDGGTGLGLSIVKAIVEQHGGRIYYQRENGWNVFQMDFIR